MRKLSVLFITISFSLSVWAAAPKTSDEALLNTSPTSSTQSAPSQQIPNNNTIYSDDSSYSDAQTTLSGSSSDRSWVGSQQNPWSESEQMPSDEERLSGSSTAVPSGNTMNDQNKAFEMCRSVNPERNCADVVRSCMGQRNLENCIQRSGNQ